ncbi:HdeD family acid-resistance protein [Andreprevotia chitinilytica]|uniref:HdeD family acid-resistance protein n=1 Tax=Andreprevotia chitinilytica TaxID=396808 RepID=UPI0006925E86|nr:DUF308 domain-containing protein [Andreprevotia chitinilytica]
MSLTPTETNYAKPLAIILIVVGIISIVAPLASSIAIAMLFAGLVAAAGVLQLMLAFQPQHAMGRIWHVLAALVLIVGGGYLLCSPIEAVASLTLAIAWLFIATGIFRIVAWVGIRALPGSIWMLFDGIITTLLGFMLSAQWPASGLWAIGTLVGISFVFNGISALQYASLIKRGRY